MILYHMTNKQSAERILSEGLGLDREWYLLRILEICKYYNCDSEKIIPIMNTFSGHTEYEGSVSFFPDYDMLSSVEKYAGYGGEFRGLTIKRILKKVARNLGISIKSMDVGYWLNNITGNHTPAYVIVVDIPVNMIANLSDVGKRCELYTHGKVPPTFIKEAHPYGKSKLSLL